jgi:cytochrome d ubiquinol oxidase subunit I
VSQDYLLEARQMQAMSFAVHIPLVCFGIALPSLVVFTEWLHLHTGDPLYRTLARSWSKVMISLFAVGVVTGTVLSFELGLLWPAFMATFGDVFGVAFAAEGFSFFVEAIFIAIYVYGWDRLSPRMHLLSGIPVVIAGFAGSLFVISVNGWMNHPGGFALRDGSVVDVDPFSALFANSFFWHELIHMYLGGFIVTGFAIAAAYAWGWLRGRRGRYHRTALVIPLTLAALAAPVQVVVGDWAARTVASSSRSSSPRSRGSPRPPGARASEHLVGWYDGSGVRYGIEIPKLLSLLAFHEPNATVTGLDAVPEGCANAFMQLVGTRVAHRQAGRADALWLADPRRQGQAGGLIWRLEPQRPVRAVFVVVPDVDPQDPLEMAAADDQQPVQALGTDRANPSLGVRVRFGRPHRRQQHLGTLGAEHVVKAAGELRVMVADKPGRG